MVIRKGNTELKQQKGASGLGIRKSFSSVREEQSSTGEHSSEQDGNLSINRWSSYSKNDASALGEEDGSIEQ